MKVTREESIEILAKAGLDAEECLDRYGEFYDDLYYNGDKEYVDILERIALPVAEKFLKKYKDLIGHLVNVRGDYFSSDREIVALTMAICAMNISVA